MTEWLVRWVRFVSHHARTALVLIFLATTLLGWVAVTQFRINSDLGQLIDQTSDWRVDFDHFQAEFPDLVKTAVIVVSGPSLSELEEVTQVVVTKLRMRSDLFSSVSAPGSEPFFRDHALLYLDLNRFDDVVDRLAEAQPLLSRVSREPNLATVFDLVRDAVDRDADVEVERIVEYLQHAGASALAGQVQPIRWADEFFGVQGTRYQLIFVKPNSAFDVALPDEQVMVALRELRAEMNLPSGVRVEFTGEIPLQHEEIEAAVDGVTMAGWLALALLLVVLIVGVRSGKIIGATFSMLAIGILWTSAYAMLSVGEYNTLSIVFVVMFFGLGVDFALHFSLRFQEAVNRGDELTQEALASSTRSVGRAIALCSLTTGVGFLGFWPTAYEGLADLGVISAGGMVIACFLTFTYLPAFYSVFGEPRAHEMDLPTSEGIVQWLLARRTLVVVVVVIGGIAAAFGASRASFDYSVLAIKDPNSESMLALRELQAAGLATDYQLAIVREGAVDRAALEQLAVVREVVVPSDQVPRDQEQKLAELEELQFMYWDFLETDITKTPTSGSDRITAAENLLATLVASGQHPELAELLGRFKTSDVSSWNQWQDNILIDLVDEMAWLQRALLVGEVDMTDIPDSVASRLVSSNGQQLTIVRPADNIAEVESLSAFITGVRAIEPNATGRPVIEWGVGQIVIEAFQQALLYALVGIGLILLLALKKIRLTFLVLCPLVLAALCSFAIGVALDLPINMANVLVLPLIFGLGVDNGIHVVDRFLGEGDVDHLMHSSTPRAVLLSTMTTIGAFAALSISPHMGTASIGLLLTISIGFLLVFTVFLLPVLLELVGVGSQAREMRGVS